MQIIYKITFSHSAVGSSESAAFLLFLAVVPIWDYRFSYVTYAKDFS